MNERKMHEYRGAFNAGLIELLPPGAKKYLDIGCADGVFGEYLLSRGIAKEVVGLEINPVTAEIAGKRLSKVFCGNAEELDLPYPGDYFDCLIYGDALEHMREPEMLLVKHLKYLKDGAYVICSIPNIRNLFIIHHLLGGNWTYTDWGILDRTHLRFFTLKEIRKILSNVGLIIEEVKPSLREGEWYAKMYGPEHIETEFIRRYNALLELCLKNEDICLWLKKIFPLAEFSREEAIELFTVQFHIRARKVG